MSHRLKCTACGFLIVFLANADWAMANTTSLGDIAFNTLIPSAVGSPGVNDFAIDNFTGGFSLPPDFPASDPLTFLNSTLTLTVTGGSQQTIDLGDLGPGSYTPVSLQFSDATNFIAATFSATLSPTEFSLSDGTIFQTASSQILVNLTPSAGSTLSPDTDFALITASSTQSAVPEPATGALVVALLGFGLWFRMRARF